MALRKGWAAWVTGHSWGGRGQKQKAATDLTNYKDSWLSVIVFWGCCTLKILTSHAKIVSIEAKTLVGAKHILKYGDIDLVTDNVDGRDANVLTLSVTSDFY